MLRTPFFASIFKALRALLFESRLISIFSPALKWRNGKNGSCIFRFLDSYVKPLASKVKILMTFERQKHRKLKIWLLILAKSTLPARQIGCVYLKRFVSLSRDGGTNKQSHK